MDKLIVAAARLVGVGAALAFGWIFGENVATKVVDRIDSRAEKKNSNQIQKASQPG